MRIQPRDAIQIELDERRRGDGRRGQHPRLFGSSREGQIAHVHVEADYHLTGAADRYGDEMSCVFCAIVAGQAPAIRIYEDDGYLAILDIRPFTRGHTLVMPKQHTVDLTDTPPETLAGMVTIGQRIAKAARATELADATNIGINDGQAAFQSVFHIHLHMRRGATATNCRSPRG